LLFDFVFVSLQRYKITVSHKALTKHFSTKQRKIKENNAMSFSTNTLIFNAFAFPCYPAKIGVEAHSRLNKT